jgi:DNA polymerase-1
MPRKAKPCELDRPIFDAVELESYRPEDTDTLKESFNTDNAVVARIAEALRKLVWPKNYFIANTPALMERLALAIEREQAFAFDVETNGLNAWKHKLLCCSFWVGGEGYVVPLEHQLMATTSLADFQKLAPYFADPSIRRYNHKIKFDIHFLMEQAGLPLGTVYCDTLTQSQVINPDTQFSHGLKELSAHYGLAADTGNYKKQFGNTAWSYIEPKLASYYAIKDCELVHKLMARQDTILESKPKLKSLFWDVIPAERKGLRLDTDYVKNVLKPTVAKGLAEATAALAPYIQPHLEHAKGPKDTETPTVSEVLSSPTKLARVAFEKLEVPLIKFVTLRRNKVTGEYTDRSLDKEAIAGLRSTVPFIALLAEWRMWDTVRKLFTDKLDRWNCKGYVHPDINLIVSTGRFSMSDPNLQQIPSRMGSLVRAAFIPDEGNVFLSCDFSSQEMRILASYSQDPTLLRMFNDPKALDPYSEIALAVCHDPSFDKDAFRVMPKDKRKKHVVYIQFKSLVLGLGFGMGHVKYARSMGIPTKQGKVNYDAYYKTLTRVKSYQDQAIKFAKLNGFIRTMLGRERPLPFINVVDSSGLQGKAERAAMNTPIQGSAADMVKLAALRVQDTIDECKWPMRIASIIHDEILFEVNEAWARANPDCIRDIQYTMETALPLRNVPMVCSADFERRWGESMDIDATDTILDDLDDAA